MQPKTANFAITRMEHPETSTFGWQVRIQRRKVRYAKYFADRSLGGPENSLQAARAWRDKVLAKLSETEGVRVCLTSARNSSGVVGVSRVTISGPNGVAYYFWQATWSLGDGERRCVRFSVKRYGERQAFRLAVQARREGTRG
ncbi:MAG: AP2/ERF family transcription factor [Luteolibacter sp.]